MVSAVKLRVDQHIFDVMLSAMRGEGLMQTSVTKKGRNGKGAAKLFGGSKKHSKAKKVTKSSKKSKAKASTKTKKLCDVKAVAGSINHKKQQVVKIVNVSHKKLKKMKK